MDEPRAARHEEHEPVNNDDVDWYVALCLGGMQAVVKTEIERHVAACGQRAEVRMFNEDCRGAPVLFEGVHDGQAGCGKLLVATDASPEALRNLRCVQALFALVAHDESLDIGLPTPTNPAGAGGDPPRNVDPQERTSKATPAKDPNPSEAALARLESLVTEAPLWSAAVNVWRRFRTSQAQAQPSVAMAAAAVAAAAAAADTGGINDLDRPPEKEAGDGDASQAVGGVDVTRLKFRSSVVRDGRHPFGSVEASPRLGGAVWSVNPGWTVDLKGYDVEVVALILERSVVVGLALDGDRTKRCSNGRIPREDKGFIETGKRVSSLRPSTAYLMLRLAEPRAGDIVVDCMCGVGTIPFLGASWFPKVFLLGGEVDDDAIDHLRGNGRSVRRSTGPTRAAGAAAACAWDAQCLPLRDSSVDAMVVDMPFGKTCGTPRQNAKLYPQVMAEMARVLRPGSGRCVLLVAQPHLLGLPGIQRDNVKDRKRQRKKERERECAVQDLHRNGGGTEGAAASDEHGRSEKRERGNAISRPAGSSSGASGASLDKADEVTESGAKTNKHTYPPQQASQHSASPAFLQASNADLRREGKVGGGAAPGALWHVRARHKVNVGGLISHLLILQRTNEPSPVPRSGRRKRLVGMDAYCKHRKEDKGGVNANPL